jgi:hypothetical protein
VVDAPPAPSRPEPAVAPEPAADGEPGPARRFAAAARLFSRLAFWRRKGEADKTADEEAETQRDILPPSPTGETAEVPPRRPLGKRILLFFMRKTVWLPTAGILLVMLGALASTLLTRGQHADQDQALRSLQAAKLQLEQENRKLRAMPPIVATAAKPTAATPTTPAHEATDPAFDIGVGAGTGTSMPAEDSGDCLVTDKGKVGESLRRCIEAFNSATSGNTRKR